MSNIYKIPAPDDSLDEASEWVAKLDRGLTASEEQELIVWLQVSNANVESLIEVTELWDKMESLSRLSELFPRAVEVKSRKWRPFVAIAASLIAFFATGLTYWVLSGENVQGNTIAVVDPSSDTTVQTGIGEQSSVSLPDGSQLTLNTDTSVSFSYSNTQRSIELIRGEVHVQVAHDPSRPFNAVVRENWVQAVGTAFNLRLTDQEDLEVIVTEGKVIYGAFGFKESRTSEPGASKYQKSVNANTDKILKAGQRMQIGGGEEKLDELLPDALEVKLSWQHGNLVFQGEPLEVALREVERYAPVEFVILDEKIKSVRVAGLFKAGDIDGLLATLKENFNLSYRRMGDKKVLLEEIQSDD